MGGNATPLRAVRSLCSLAVIGSLLALTPAMAAIELDGAGKVKMYGDFRFRLESDWDSQRADGSERDDRDRARIRARLGFTVNPGDNTEFGVRFRTGSDDSHQSPHITIIDFDDNDTGDAHVNLDKWYLKRKGGMVSGWVGRNGFPFWKQNELFWDDDVTPAGIALGGGSDEFKINAGYFSLPVGMRQFSGNLGAIQGVLSGSANNMDVTAALGFFRFEADNNDVDGALLQAGNGGRDYGIVVANFQAKTKVGGQSLKLGVDYMSNGEDYSATDPDPVTAANRDETDGYVLSVGYGGTSPGNWLAAYYYANIEKFAVNASYAQDDWMRWGSAVETDASDFKGHELRLGYGLAKNTNLIARLYLVEALTSDQDGNRFRLDFNYKF